MSSDLQIIKEAMLAEQRYIETRGPNWTPSLRRIVERIKRLERRRDIIDEELRHDLVEILNPHTN